MGKEHVTSCVTVAGRGQCRAMIERDVQGSTNNAITKELSNGSTEHCIATMRLNVTLNERRAYSQDPMNEVRRRRH